MRFFCALSAIFFAPAFQPKVYKIKANFYVENRESVPIPILSDNTTIFPYKRYYTIVIIHQPTPKVNLFGRVVRKCYVFAQNNIYSFML